MTLYELGLEYEDRVKELTEQIHRLNLKKRSLEGNRLLLVKRRIYLLYQDAAYCRETAKKLKAYYERSLENGQNSIQP